MEQYKAPFVLLPPVPCPFLLPQSEWWMLSGPFPAPTSASFFLTQPWIHGGAPILASPNTLMCFSKSQQWPDCGQGDRRAGFLEAVLHFAPDSTLGRRGPFRRLLRSLFRPQGFALDSGTRGATLSEFLIQHQGRDETMFLLVQSSSYVICLSRISACSKRKPTSHHK